MIEGDLAIQILHIISLFFGIVGAALICYGGIRATISILLLETGRKEKNYQSVRHDLTDKIVFGLEFFIAGDVIVTLVSPTLDELILLGTTVVIRVILGYFLSKETMEYKFE